ncbi:MAG TPA: GNAT family N-acetyltransferase [Bacteroidales bacterium]|nr:GNAT family N-acetyltransferase [Bacteroidales bacterium]
MVQPPINTVTIRREVNPGDPSAIRIITESSGFFRPDEVEVAVELADEALLKGLASGYHFLLAEMDGATVGFACYGHIACTIGSYDLYWIAVHQDFRGKGVGQLLLREVETDILALNGRKIYIETSSQKKYQPTQKFYLSAGYTLVATFEDFYEKEDHKLVYCRTL